MNFIKHFSRSTQSRKSSWLTWTCWSCLWSLQWCIYCHVGKWAYLILSWSASYKHWPRMWSGTVIRMRNWALIWLIKCLQMSHWRNQSIWQSNSDYKSKIQKIWRNSNGLSSQLSDKTCYGKEECSSLPLWSSTVKLMRKKPTELSGTTNNICHTSLDCHSWLKRMKRDTTSIHNQRWTITSLVTYIQSFRKAFLWVTPSSSSWPTPIRSWSSIPPGFYAKLSR